MADQDLKHDVDVQALLNYAEALVAKATANPIDVSSTSTGELVTRWFDYKKELDELGVSVKKIKDMQDILAKEITDRMRAEDMDKISTKAGTISLTPKSMPSVEDMYGFVKWVSEDLDNRIGFLTKKVNEKAVNEMLEEKGMLPPGVKTYLEDRLNKRAKK